MSSLLCGVDSNTLQMLTRVFPQNKECHQKRDGGGGIFLSLPEMFLDELILGCASRHLKED